MIIFRQEKLVQRPQNPVAQIVRRVAEKKAHASTTMLTKMQMFTNNYIGPLPHGYGTCRQFRQYFSKKYLVSCSQRNHCFEDKVFFPCYTRWWDIHRAWRFPSHRILELSDIPQVTFVYTSIANRRTPVKIRHLLNLSYLQSKHLLFLGLPPKAVFVSGHSPQNVLFNPHPPPPLKHPTPL